MLSRRLARNSSSIRRILEEARKLSAGRLYTGSGEALAFTFPDGKDLDEAMHFRVTPKAICMLEEVNVKENITNKVQGIAVTTDDEHTEDMRFAAILTKAISIEGCKAIESGKNPLDLRRGMKMAVDVVMEHLKKDSKMITTSKEITQVAMVATNGDKEIGDAISRAMELVGKDGAIMIMDNERSGVELEIVRGMKLDNRGFISSILVGKNKIQELHNPLILIHDGKISDSTTIMPTLEIAMQDRRSLLIIADEVMGPALMTLIANKFSLDFEVCAIKSPGVGRNKILYLEDLAIFTGGKVISEEFGLQLVDVRADMLGTAKLVHILKNETIIIHSGGDKKALEARCEEMKLAMQPDQEGEDVKERFSTLTGICALLKIGGPSDAERIGKKAQVAKALKVVKAAIEEGIVPGCGFGLLYVSRHLESLKPVACDVASGIRVIQNAIKAPVLLYSQKAGFEGVDKILQEGNLHSAYNILRKGYEDMVEDGLIEPVSVVKEDLMDAFRDFAGFDLE